MLTRERLHWQRYLVTSFRVLLVIALLLPSLMRTPITRADTPPPQPERATTTHGLPAVGVSYKMRVEEDGLYRLTYADLQAAGLPVDVLDPRTFKVWEQGVEIAIFVMGEEDGSFDPGDALYFYGEMARTKYQDPNVYWLTYGGAPGKRMTLRDVTPTGASSPAPFLRTLHLEEDKDYRRSVPMEAGADHWYWESYFACSGTFCFADDTKTYTFTLPNLSTGTHTAVLRPRIRGITSYLANPDHHLEFYVNGTKVGDAYWDGMDEFTGEFTFPQSLLITGTNTITYYAPLDIPGVDEERGLTNWIEVDYYDIYEAENDRLWFYLDSPGTWQPTLTNFSSPDIFLFDLTDRRNPVRLTNAIVSGSGPYAITLEDTVGGRTRYFAVAASAALTPASITLDTPSDLKNSANSADWIVITHRAFMAQAQQLAAHRAAFSGLRTMVVDVQDVYDEFSGGLLDPEAIRQFLAYTQVHWTPPAPRYVVLMGDGNFDYKNNLWHAEEQFIPPYLDLVDCFLGETAADNRFVAGPRTNSNPNALECQKHAMPFMALGRLPVNNVAEAEGMVRRIICYENPSDPICASTTPPAGWDQRIIFVADKNDNAGAFTCHSDEVAGQQRCPDQDFGFKPVSPRAAPRSPANRAPYASLAVVGATGTITTTRGGFIGDYIWYDSNGNGWPDVGETGIDGVIVNLWEDVDNDGTLSAPDRLVATVSSGDNPNTTDTEQGWYGFDGLAKANYLVEIDAANFDPGGALEGMVLSSGQNPWPVHMDGEIPDEYTRIKLYYQDEYAPGVVPFTTGQDMKSALIDAINAGAAFVTYNGHASTWKWSGADVWDVYAIPNLTNTNAWPIFLPMTCLEGQFQIINQRSLSEAIVRALDTNGNPVGAVAAWGPTGLGVATGHTFLYTGFFEALFRENITTIGDAILFAKRKLYDSNSLFKDLIETYTLFGDPAMQVRVPRPDLQVTKVAEPAGLVQPGDTLTYTIRVNNAGPITAFDVVITDTLPAELLPQRWETSGEPVSLRPGTTYVWEGSELAPGESITITLVAQVDPGASAGTPVVNVVTVSSGTGDTNPDNNTATMVSDVGSVYALGGRTYIDSNASRSYDPGETGLSNVSLTLYSGNTALATTVSDASGMYTFTNVVPGTYTVTVSAPAGYVPTGGTSHVVTVTSASVLDVNFGFISPTGVTLVALEGRVERAGVVLRWRVRDEEGIVGYHVYRGADPDAPRTRITREVIPALGTGQATYTFQDRPPALSRWYYWVYAQAQQGDGTWFGPIAVDIQAPRARRTFVPFLP